MAVLFAQHTLIIKCIDSRAYGVSSGNDTPFSFALSTIALQLLVAISLNNNTGDGNNSGSKVCKI